MSFRLRLDVSITLPSGAWLGIILLLVRIGSLIF